MRVLLFTGKGGVGKTTIAAATAVRAAAAGSRTLVMSTDPAHSLADSFEVEVGARATPVADNLWAQQIDAQERLEDNWREIQDYFLSLMQLSLFKIAWYAHKNGQLPDDYFNSWTSRVWEIGQEKSFRSMIDNPAMKIMHDDFDAYVRRLIHAPTP